MNKAKLIKQGHNTVEFLVARKFLTCIQKVQLLSDHCCYIFYLVLVWLFWYGFIWGCPLWFGGVHWKLSTEVTNGPKSCQFLHALTSNSLLITKTQIWQTMTNALSWILCLIWYGYALFCAQVWLWLKVNTFSCHRQVTKIYVAEAKKQIWDEKLNKDCTLARNLYFDISDLIFTFKEK